MLKNEENNGTDEIGLVTPPLRTAHNGKNKSQGLPGAWGRINGCIYYVHQLH